jgi:hypothetical protein
MAGFVRGMGSVCLVLGIYYADRPDGWSGSTSASLSVFVGGFSHLHSLRWRH